MHAPRHPLPMQRRHQYEVSIETITAGILAVLIAVPSPISASLSIGAALSLALTPVIFPAIWRNTGGRWLLIATLALVPIGWLVAQTSLLQDNGRTFNMQVFLYQAALPVGLLASLAGAYWCITRLGLPRFLLLAFTGLLVAKLFSINQDNPWKYGLALPMSMLAILFVARSRLLLAFAVTTLSAVSIAANFRSWTAILAITAVLAVFARSQWTQTSASRVASLGLVTLAAVPLATWLVIEASTAGLLGDYLEQRTDKQLSASDGNLLLGGRPEWGAAIALFRENPLGIGIGVTPSSEDYWLAIRSMPLGSQGLQDISNVAKSFLQGQVNFHSTFWTFWAVYGVAGIIFSFLGLLNLARATLLAVTKLQRMNVRAAVVLLMLSSTWDILFSPITATLSIALATALHVFDGPDVTPIPTEDSRYETRATN